MRFRINLVLKDGTATFLFSCSDKFPSVSLRNLPSTSDSCRLIRCPIPACITSGLIEKTWPSFNFDMKKRFF